MLCGFLLMQISYTRHALKVYRIFRGYRILIILKYNWDFTYLAVLKLLYNKELIRL